MFKRLFWLSVGIVAGLWLSWRATTVVRLTVDRYVPARISDRVRVLNDAIEKRRQLIRARKEPARARTSR